MPHKRRTTGADVRRTLTVYGCEVRKLLAQHLVRLALSAAALAPVVYVVALTFFQKGTPEADRAFARHVLDSGLAIPLFQLGWGLSWFLPALTAVVAVGIFAGEEQAGTLKTILTRSASRSQVFAGKVLATATHTATTFAVLGAVALAVGGARFGLSAVPSLSGIELRAPEAILLIVASFALMTIPMLAFAAIGVLFSVLTRNVIAAAVATMATLPAMAGLGILFGGGSAWRDYLLLTHFGAWQGLFHDPIHWEGVARAVGVSVAYAAPALLWAHAVFRRRDVTSG